MFWTCSFEALPKPTTACFTSLDVYWATSHPASAANLDREERASGAASVSLVSTVTPNTQGVGAPAADAPSAMPETAARTMASPPCV